MQVSEIIDFSSIVPEQRNVYSFNPSIARWKDNIYLCAYRSFIRYKDVDSKRYDPLFDPNHPWLGGNNSTTWWRTIDGKDQTCFFLMKIDVEISDVKSLNNGQSLYDATNNKLTNFTGINGVDARLLHLTGDYFLLSYNTNFRNELQIKAGNCKSGCFIIATRLIRLNAQGFLGLYGENILCPQISNQTEKNWSFWVYNKNVFFSYGLSPSHEFYNVQINFSTGAMRCVPMPTTDVLSYYGNLEKVYNSGSKDKFFHISVTTPALPFGNERYIGVGHVKYKNQEEYIRLVRTSPLANFYSQTKTFKRHPIYDYLMFIYEFNPITGQVTRVSDMFLPGDTEYILAFPSGLEFTPNGDIIISYGDHDSSCKFITIRRDIVNKILKPVGVINNVLLPQAKDLYFFSFPQTCIDRNGLCQLILNF
jgi:hypothetical protein